MKVSFMGLHLKYLSLIITVVSAIAGCTGEPHGNISETGNSPFDLIRIIPALQFPPNIAPLNFKITKDGTAFYARFSADSKTMIETDSKNGIITIPARKWKKFLEENKGRDFNIEIYIKDKKTGWSKFSTVTTKIAPEPIDPYITYRLLYPGYESWKEIFIKQRNLESFSERSIIENSLVEENCLNCHSYNNTGRPNNFMVHMRGAWGAPISITTGNSKRSTSKPMR